ncbi:hypothetical protein [Burkholderia glumae]|uniref:Uncharacterized protein n=1 Tax=Burkholderia glumae TaxID=337 RepID=A0ABY5BDE0_BURGL|nr:hypothetical protein [Burkholderia glumae]KHJ60260.1 hypothetical protein NCPPB3923_25025 [Burkholderia glumae]MCM2547165.1 hypothetical protein [Burkholderia glumae]MCM2552644.1 hypothetical protein [Burkholderia glumae]MCR1771127.1 hypothetical protein [Burkholderia glumae]NVE26216.1 hypothetical protein [Burkholderia glumae]
MNLGLTDSQITAYALNEVLRHLGDAMHRDIAGTDLAKARAGRFDLYGALVQVPRAAKNRAASNYRCDAAGPRDMRRGKR